MGQYAAGVHLYILRPGAFCISDFFAIIECKYTNVVATGYNVVVAMQVTPIREFTLKDHWEEFTFGGGYNHVSQH